ncbi:hypothetical protein GCM10023405_40970 [Streptomonospora salina]
MRRLVLPALLTAGLSAVAMAPASADSVPEAGAVVDDLRNDNVYIDPDITTDQLPQAERDTLADAADSAANPTYYVVLPSGTLNSEASVDSYIEDVQPEVGDGTYAVLAGSQTLVINSTELDASEDDALREDLLSRNEGQVDTLVAVPEAVEDQESADAASSAFGAILLGLLVVAVAGGGFFLYRGKKRRDEQKAKELAEIKEMASEDVVRLGEDIAGLRIDLSAVDEATRTDYTHAMDSYDRAKATLDTITEPEQVKEVTTALEDGRYAMVATRARMNGEPVPERRQPCFFNPQHGPSDQDVMWAPPGGTSRSVPACPACAQAVHSGGDPDVRQVEVDGQRRPYYDAGPAYAPYAGGYFGMDMMGGMFTGMMMGSMMGSMMGGGMMGGDMGGGADMGGDFGGGGDFGDFGGGDFGGFDF